MGKGLLPPPSELLVKVKLHNCSAACAQVCILCNSANGSIVAPAALAHLALCLFNSNGNALNSALELALAYFDIYIGNAEYGSKLCVSGKLCNGLFL